MNDDEIKERAKKEICSCGHARIEHGGLVFHGPCYEHGCGCRKYTWTPSPAHKGAGR